MACRRGPGHSMACHRSARLACGPYRVFGTATPWPSGRAALPHRTARRTAHGHALRSSAPPPNACGGCSTGAAAKPRGAGGRRGLRRQSCPSRDGRCGTRARGAQTGRRRLAGCGRVQLLGSPLADPSHRHWRNLWARGGAWRRVARNQGVGPGQRRGFRIHCNQRDPHGIAALSRFAASNAATNAALQYWFANFALTRCHSRRV